MSGVIINAPAKINLHLEVTGRRSDGYHSIISVFQTVSLYDTVKIYSEGEEGFYSLSGGFDFPAEENLITRALEVFREITGINSGVVVECVKRIPAGSGLGGGSSDAAAVLAGLDLLFGTSLTKEELQSAGARIGSDVPFFFSSATALVSGRGEVVEPLPTLWELPVLIIDTGIHVSTKAAYDKLDRAGTERRSLPDPVSVYTDHPSKWSFFNDFFEILNTENPIYRGTLAALKTLGAVFSSVSGSGSSVFGIFEDEKSAEYALNRLKTEFRAVHKGKMLANPLEAVYNS